MMTCCCRKPKEDAVYSKVCKPKPVTKVRNHILVHKYSVVTPYGMCAKLFCKDSVLHENPDIFRNVLYFPAEGKRKATGL